MCAYVYIYILLGYVCTHIYKYASFSILTLVVIYAIGCIIIQYVCALFMLSDLWIVGKICLESSLPLSVFSSHSSICWFSSSVISNKWSTGFTFHLGLLNLEVKGLLCDQLCWKELEICIDFRSRTQGFWDLCFLNRCFFPLTCLFPLSSHVFSFCNFRSDCLSVCWESGSEANPELYVCGILLVLPRICLTDCNIWK